MRREELNILFAIIQWVTKISRVFSIYVLGSRYEKIPMHYEN